jgi:hypothetical protein
LDDYRDLKESLQSGYRLQKPEFATQSIYDIMLSCWKEEKKERPVRKLGRFSEFSWGIS